MANIGNFKQNDKELKGEIVTLSVQTKNVRIVPEGEQSSENTPTHRVYVGHAKIAAAWAKTSREGRDYLSVKIDDPSFVAPIFANLIEDEVKDLRRSIGNIKPAMRQPPTTTRTRNRFRLF